MSETEYDVVIVGAGFAGMYMLHKVRALGLSVRVYEAGDGVGGTWYWNRYPGARCDVESMDYSYSFSPELEQDWEWTERYPRQPEILRYAEHVADRFDLRRDIAFNSRVSAAAYDEGAGRWRLTVNDERVSARYVVMATGCLSVPKWPEVDGIGSFRGRVFHTAQWPHEGVDFTGRRVAVIGTGSSGIQSIPHIAAQAAHTTVFQRTANYSIPARHGPLDPREQKEIKTRYRELRQEARMSASGVPRPMPTKSALEVDPAERERVFWEGWTRGGLFGISGAYTDIRSDQAANDTAAEFIRARIRETVTDPERAETLSPRDHPFATKRPCLDTDYYQTYNRDDVDLVDLKKTPLAEITAAGVRTSDGEYAVDDVVFATGFDAMTGALLAVDPVGRDGVRLSDKWSAGPRAYLGLGMAGFPNLFTVTGPGSPSVLSNMMVSIEQHVEWIAQCLADLNGARIEPAPDAEDAWVAHVRDVGAETLFPKANSWYMGANVPGKPRVFMPYVGGVGAYRETCDRVTANGYEGFVIS